MKEEKEIDWEQVDREFDSYCLKCAELDKQIAEERQKPMSLEDLERINEEVLKFCQENGLSYVMIEKTDNEDKK